VLAALGVLLATLDLYGVIAYSVGRYGPSSCRPFWSRERRPQI